MGLFSNKRQTSPVSAQPAPAPTTTTTTTTRHSHRTSNTGSGGLFSRRRRSSSLSSSDFESSPTHASRRTNRVSRTSGSGGGLTSLFHRNSVPEDPTLTAARQRVLAAEEAEREADRALAAARLSVRDARDHVKVLENEAREEARLAKIKQQGARDLGKRAAPLGRHDRY